MDRCAQHNRESFPPGRELAAVQVTGEPNLTWAGAAADAAFPGARDALVRGVLAGAAAKREARATAAIGFAVGPDIDPAASGFGAWFCS